MEQDETIYEYRYRGEPFRFEAHQDHEAAQWRAYAVLHFRERLGPAFEETGLEGPFRVTLPPGVVVDHPRKSSAGSRV